jgi:hypothetical protein
METIVAIAVLSVVAVSLGALSSAIQVSSDYTFGHAAATRQATVALQRIKRHVSTATATADFPGFAVFSEEVDGWQFPDTLVIWHPDGQPANPAGPPRFDELIIYCPDPTEPNRLLEITTPQDARSTPPLSDTAAWQNALAAIKSSNTTERVVLIETLQTAEVNASNPRRGVVRFVQRVLPSQNEWTAYENGSLAWDNIAWVQDIHGSTMGLRQAWCRIELQLVAEEPETGTGSETVLPYFGSATLYYQLQR